MFNNKIIKAVSFGEVLFDVFESEKKIGGAPLNLALRTASFGFPVAMISAIGNDEDGQTILDYTRDNHLNTSGIQTTSEYETGVVQVSLNDRGSATYEIKFPAAWDFISVNDSILNTVKEADVFFFGSLASRNKASRDTLFALLDSNANMFKVFDVNLRKPFYETELLQQLMDKADFIKFNDEEILEIAGELGLKSDDLEENIYFISEKTNTPAICVTLGKHGSILLWDGVIYSHGGYPVTVADTVGAGDSFLASLTAKLLTGHSPDDALDFASAVGAMVATFTGANPQIDYTKLNQLIKQSL